MANRKGSNRSKKHGSGGTSLPSTNGSLSAKVARLTDPLSAESQLGTIRRLESQLSAAQSQLKASEAKRRHAEGELSDARTQLDLLVSTQDKVTARKIERSAKGKPSGTATALICWNDWHLEERIDPDVIDGANEFNLDVAARRIGKLFDKQLELLDFTRRLSNIDELVVWLGGDLINNQLHEESAESNFALPGEAIEMVQDYIATGVDSLLKHAGVKTIRIVTSWGNHSRTTRKRHISTGYGHSWEWVAYRNLARAYKKDTRLHWQVGKGYHNWLDIQGYGVRFHHGDAVRFGGGVGGVTIPLRKKIAQWNKQRRADLDVLGHFHQYITTRDFVVCPCLCGYNAYAQEIGAEFEPPAQSIHVLDRQYGQVLSMKTFVDEA